MKYLLFSIVPLLLLSQCGTIEENTLSNKDFEETTINEFEEYLSSGNAPKVLEKIQLLSFIDSGLTQETADKYSEKARSGLSDDLKQAIDNKDYLEAIRLYHAVKAVAATHYSGEWNYQALLIQQADSLLGEGNSIAALHYFEKALEINPAGITEDQFVTYGKLAYESQNNYVLSKIYFHREQIGSGIPTQYSGYTVDVPTPVQMMNGTVTIWVNKGIRIEQGVGLPDRVIGSGFYIDSRGFLLTNYHVIESEVDPEYEGFSRLYIRPPESQEDKIPATVIGYDKILDIALLKVDIEPQFIFSLTDVKDLSPGSRIYALGSPLGLENTITSGIISATGRRFLQIGDALQVDSPINPGNSGGPLVDAEGNLVGVVFAGLEQFEGLNFAIPSHWIKMIVPQLYNTGSVQHHWLGMSVFEAEKGLEILYILPGSPAEKAGFELGDTITAIDGLPCHTLKDAQEQLMDYPIAKLFTIEWIRDKKNYNGIILPGVRPFSPIEKALEIDDRDNIITPLFGMKIEKVSTFKRGKDFIIKKVYQGTIADETGLSANDPLSIHNWYVDEDNQYALMQVFIKKQKAGFLESSVQMAAYLEVDSFI
jgi:S1-C subfamily serine protease